MEWFAEGEPKGLETFEMTPYRLPSGVVLACACGLVLAAASGAAAQFLPGPAQSTPPGQFPAPGQASPFPPPGQSGFGGGAFPPPPAQRNICESFIPLREAAEKQAAAIRAAGEKQLPREQVCGLFKRFVVTEAKVVKFLVDHQAACGVPKEAVAGAKASHANALKIRTAVCSAQAAPAGPTLSDALGGPIIADDTTAKQPGRGTFDTLTGNVLAR
jgi:hypothetical protein